MKIKSTLKRDKTQYFVKAESLTQAYESTEPVDYIVNVDEKVLDIEKLYPTSYRVYNRDPETSMWKLILEDEGKPTLYFLRDCGTQTV